MPSRGQLNRTNYETADPAPSAMLAGEGPKTFGKGNTQPVRLYVNGVFYSYLRGQRNSYQHTALLKLQGVQDSKAAEFYFGKRVAYIYKGKVPKNGTRFRVKWGKIVRAHGSNGAVRAKFRSNLPASALGSRVRVMLYPSRV
eukprot:g4931.t1